MLHLIYSWLIVWSGLTFLSICIYQKKKRSSFFVFCFCWELVVYFPIYNVRNILCFSKNIYIESRLSPSQRFTHPLIRYPLHMILSLGKIDMWLTAERCCTTSHFLNLNDTMPSFETIYIYIYSVKYFRTVARGELALFSEKNGFFLN